VAGRVAVVTGGLSGIGAATVVALRAAGVDVRVFDLRPSPDSTLVDVADEEQCLQAVSALRQVDILVNCAGIAGPGGPVVTVPGCEAERVVAVNLLGTYHMCRAVLPMMLERGWGRIVNLSSVAGKEGNPNSAAYSASKGGVIAFTKALAKEVAGNGVLVNCVTPSVIDTPLVRGIAPDRIAAILTKIPMGRIGQPAEVAAMIAWLCSDDCSFSTGAVFDVSGGRAGY
jgi:NAD(P)-dependent dehydrogenase (short-subunit alcohol dehydrogenase family)